MKKNKFSKALNHLKSKKLDKKIKKLEEAAPTNNMSGIYQQSPRADAAFRLGELDPPRRFVAGADGSWPAGIPGTPGEPYYERPAGYWKGTVDWETINEPKFGFNAAQGNNTDGLIDPVTNVVKTHLPPNSRSFILGPLVDGFVPNHIGDAFTRIGYIEKDTRQFVLLGIIQGEWVEGLNDEVSGGTYPVFNGQSNQFTQVNPNFTLEMALWFRNEMLKGRYVKNVSYNAVGGIPQQGNPDPDTPQPFGGNGVGGGSGNAGDNPDGKGPDGSGAGTGSGGDPTTGTEQGDPDDGKDPGENDLWGMTQAEARAKYGGMSDEELADLGIVRMPNGEFRAMTEEEKKQHEEKKKKEKFEKMMKELDKDIKKYSALQKKYEKEARDILIKFGIDVALTLFGGAILKGVLGGLTRIPSAIRFLQNLTRAKKVVKGADMLSDLGYASKATSVAKKVAASADDLSAAADDLGNKFYTTLMMSSDPKAKSAALAINKAMESGKDDLVYAAIEKAKVSVFGYAPKKVVPTTIPKIPMIKNIKIKPEFLKKSGQSFDLGAYGLEDIGVDQFKKVLTNPSAFNIRPGTAKWKKVMQYAKDYLIEFKLYGDGQELLIELDEPIENILIEDRITIRENKKRILREIKQPLREIKQLPKTEKLKGYRPNFKGKYSPQNTPDVTASKRSDQLVMAKNAEGQAWTVGDKYQKGWETTGRMNHVYARVGESNKFFEQITANNSTDVERKMQEHLNHVYHNKAMLKIDSNYQSPFEDNIEEQETYDNKINDPLFTKVAKRLKKEIDYEKKPAKVGYPNEAPPKIDPNTGMHPKFGKRYKYDKLDPISAKTMAGAPTGDPEIDANVKKAAKIKESWRSDLKNLWLGSERGDWKKKIKEDFANTTQGMKVGQTFTHVPSGQTVTTSGVLGGVETLQTFVPLFGDAIPGPSESQYGLQGFAKPIDLMRRGKKKTEELNKELDSSEKYTKEIKADEYMKARVSKNDYQIPGSKEYKDMQRVPFDEYYKTLHDQDYNKVLMGDPAERWKLMRYWAAQNKQAMNLSRIRGLKDLPDPATGKPYYTFNPTGSDTQLGEYVREKLKNVGQIHFDHNKLGQSMGQTELEFTVLSKGAPALNVYVEELDVFEKHMTQVVNLLEKDLKEHKTYLRKERYKNSSEINRITYKQAEDLIYYQDKLKDIKDHKARISAIIPDIRKAFEGNFESTAPVDYKAKKAVVDKAYEDVGKGDLEEYEKIPPDLLKAVVEGEAPDVESVLPPTQLSKLQRLPLEAKTFLKYLTNKLPPVLNNDYMGKDFVRHAFSVAVFTESGGTSVGDNIIGSGQQLTYDKKTNQVSLKFTYNFKKSAEEYAEPRYQNMNKAALLLTAYADALTGGEYGADARGLITSPLAAGWWIQIAKGFGGGKSTPGEITISLDELSKINSTMANDVKLRYNLIGKKKTTPSKSVQKIKGLAGGEARKELSLDEPVISPKKKNFREWSQQLDDMWNSDWRDELKEGMTTSDTFSYSVSGKGDVDLSITGTGYTEDGVHQLQDIEPMINVDDPHNVGKRFGKTHGYGGNTYGGISQYDSASKEAQGIENHYWMNPVTGDLDNNTNPRYSDYIYPFDRDATQAEIETATAASRVKGRNDSFRAVYPTNTFGTRHKVPPVVTNPTVGTDDDYDTVGLGLQFGRGTDTRAPLFFVPNPVNTSEIDTVQILASLPQADSITSAGTQLQLFYWSGDKPGFQSLYPANPGDYPRSNQQHDGWRPISMKPNGETDSSVNNNLIDIEKPIGYQVGKVSKFSVQIPEWVRSNSTRFMFVQIRQNGSMDRLRIYKIGYQRRNALTINTTLADEKASAFVRVGNNSQMAPEERKKKLNDMLKASREYMLKSLGFASLFNDEVKISDVVSNDLDFGSVIQGDGKYGNATFHDIIDHDKKVAAQNRATRSARQRSSATAYKRSFR